MRGPLNPRRPARGTGIGLARAARAILAALAVVTCAPRVRAEPKDDPSRGAARLSSEAAGLYDLGSYEEALAKLLRANELAPSASLEVRIARCLVRLGRLVGAEARYRGVIERGALRAGGGADTKSVAEARAELANVAVLVPTLVVAVEGPRGARLAVTLDGEPLPADALARARRVDPGAHRVEVRRDADPPLLREVTLDAGDTLRLDVVLPPLRAAEAPDLRDGANVPLRAALAVGATGLAAALANGIAAIATNHDLREACGPDRTCPSSRAGDVARYDALRVATDVGIGVAGAGLLGAIVAYALPRASHRAGGVAGTVGPGGSFVALRGSFP